MKNHKPYYSFSKKIKSGFVSNTKIVKITIINAYWQLANKILHKDHALNCSPKQFGTLVKKTPFIKDNNIDMIMHINYYIMEMLSFKAGDAFLFFWIDTIYIPENKLEGILQLLQDLQLDYKITECDKIIVTGNCITVTTNKKDLHYPIPLTKNKIKA